MRGCPDISSESLGCGVDVRHKSRPIGPAGREVQVDLDTLAVPIIGVEVTFHKLDEATRFEDTGDLIDE
jgi:hypothetical protein